MKVTCYDPEGNERFKEPVDARECVEHCGFTMERPEVKEDRIPNAADTVAAINGCESVEELEDVLIDGEGRQGVLKAFEKKMNTLKEGE